MMKRKELVTTLKKIDPAVKAKPHTPILKCFCFDGEHVLGYDDQVAIQLPLKTPFVGGIVGALLLPWLDSSMARDVKWDIHEETVEFKAGRARLTAAVMPKNGFIFEFPSDKKAHTLGPFEEDDADVIVERVSKVIVSMGMNPAHPEMMGITCYFEKDQVSLFSTNDISASRAVIPLDIPKKMQGKTYMLPPKFSSLLISSHKTEKFQSMLFGDGWVEARFVSKMRLFSKEVHETRANDYIDMFGRSVTEETVKTLVPLPKGVERAIDRLQIVLNSDQRKGEEKNAKLKVWQKDKKTYLTLSAEAETSQGVENLVLEEVHEPFSKVIRIDTVAAGLPYVDSFTVVPGSLFFASDDGFAYLAAVGSSSEE